MKLYNTLSRNIQDFKPLKDNLVRMYHCGPTVYNYAHIGNLRSYIFADTIRRAMEYAGYKTKQVINITDVGHLTNDSDNGEDKIENEAKKKNKSAREITEFYTEAFKTDLRRLNVNTLDTYFPKATEHINEQIELIKILETKNLTYKTPDGIYFDTSKFPNYGKLGNINIKNLEEGARVAKNSNKRHSTDFALWKFSGTKERRQQEWPSPWGVGFPGWHIECSAMSMKYLGPTFDIHTGGIDHVPIHHNNEISQSESATNVQYVNFWLHHEFVNIETKKMSKSEDNFFRLQTLIDNGINPMSYRYWLLTANYRSPIIFSFDAVLASQNALESIVRKISLAKNQNETNQDSIVISELKKNIENDLDTPSCIALLNESAHKIANGALSLKVIEDFDRVLGLNLVGLCLYIKNIPEEIKKLSDKREKYRLNGDWTKSDNMRVEIENGGYSIEDSPTGPVIRRSISAFSL